MKLAAALVVAMCSIAHAGPAETIGKDVTKGAVKGAKEEVHNGDVRSGAKEVSGGVIDGISEHGRELDRGARDMSRAAAQGVFLELRSELGSDGAGPLSVAVGAASQAAGREIAHGAAEELARWGTLACQGQDPATCFGAVVQRVAYDVARSAARGIADGTPATWPLWLAFGGGFAGGILSAALIALLAGQRRLIRELARSRAEPNPSP